MLDWGKSPKVLFCYSGGPWWAMSPHVHILEPSHTDSGLALGLTLASKRLVNRSSISACKLGRPSQNALRTQPSCQRKSKISCWTQRRHSSNHTKEDWGSPANLPLLHVITWGPPAKQYWAERTVQLSLAHSQNHEKQNQCCFSHWFWNGYIHSNK